MAEDKRDESYRYLGGGEVEQQKFRDHLRMRLRESNVPESLWDGLVEYIVTRRHTGHFLEAVLANDLKEACGRADNDNRVRLYDIVFFLYNYAPGGCWGTPAKVKNWLARL